MLAIIDSFGEDLPEACLSTCEEGWQIFDAFLEKYGSSYEVCERVSRVLRLGLVFFGKTANPILPSVLSRMATSFEATGYASYLWIAGKIFAHAGNENDLALRGAFQQVYERTSEKLVSMLQEQPPSQIPDGMSLYLSIH